MIHPVLPVTLGEKSVLTWYDDMSNKGLVVSDVIVPCQDAFGPPKAEADQNISGAI